MTATKAPLPALPVGAGIEAALTDSTSHSTSLPRPDSRPGNAIKAVPGF